MPIPAIVVAAGIAAATSIGTAVYQNQQAKKSAKAQKDIMMSNAENQYAAETFNALKNRYVSNLNITLLKASQDLEVESTNASVLANIDIIQQTQKFNDLMFEESIVEEWNSANLDLELLGMQRARERGAIVANQGASGTVIGEGSNKDVVIDQMTQEAMDKYIIKVGADEKVREIANARLKSKYEADMQIKKLAYEGRMKNRNTILSTQISAAEERWNQEFDYVTDMALATMGYTADSSSADNIYQSARARANANLTAGIIGAVGEFGSKVVANSKGTVLTDTFDASADHKELNS